MIQFLQRPTVKMVAAYVAGMVSTEEVKAEAFASDSGIFFVSVRYYQWRGSRILDSAYLTRYSTGSFRGTVKWHEGGQVDVKSDITSEVDCIAFDALCVLSTGKTYNQLISELPQVAVAA